MSDDDEHLFAALQRGIDAQRGYADFDTWPDSSVRDRGIGTDFAASFLALHRIQLEIQEVPQGSDPPDLLANGSIGIELTELVDPAMVSAASRQKRRGDDPYQYRDWSKQELLDWLRERVHRKDSVKPKLNRTWNDFWLVIHTDEPGLTPDLVQTYLDGWSPVTCRLLTRCFLLMSYFPTHGGRPLFELAINRTT